MRAVNRMAFLWKLEIEGFPGRTQEDLLEMVQNTTAVVKPSEREGSKYTCVEEQQMLKFRKMKTGKDCYIL